MTEAIYRQPRACQDYTPSAASLAGEVARLADGRAAVTIADLAASQLGAQYVEGIFDLLSASATVFDVGEVVFWDASADLAIRATSAGAGDYPVGRAVVAKADGETVVRTELNAVTPGLLYALLGAGTAATNTTDETILASYTIPANFLKRGDVLEVMAGVIASATNATDTFRYRLRVGGVTGSIVADTGAIDLANDDAGVLHAEISVREAGASGKIAAASISALKTTVAPVVLGETARDTTADLTLVLTVAMSVANAGNVTAAQAFTVARK